MKKVKILSLILCCLFLSGCWDKVEIDRRIFIATIGIDAGKDIGKEEESKKINPTDPFQEREIKKLDITYGFPDISKLEPGKSGTANDQYITVQDAYSMEDAFTKASTKSSRDIHLGQSKLLILSSDLLGHPNTFKEILDYLERNTKLNKMMNVVVAEGKAEDYIKFKPAMEKNIETYISGLNESTGRNATILPVTLNELIVLLRQNGNAILPKITIEKSKNELSISGIAVIKNYALKGYMTPVEVSSLEMLRGKLKGGKKVVFKDGHPVDITIEDLDRKIKFKNEEGRLVFDINLTIEGQIKGFTVDEDVFSTKSLSELEKYFNKSISEECEKVVKITQNEFLVDPIGFREVVEKYHPSLWAKIKGNWEEAYKAAEINVNVDTKIRRIGITK